LGQPFAAFRPGLKNGVDKPAERFRVPANAMKKDSLIPALNGVLLVLAVFLALATYANTQYSRKSRRMQGEMANMQNTRVILDAIAKEALAYSQTNHAIDPVLISIRLKEGPATAAPKPTTR
jgi:hypothetical protein